MYAEPSHFLLPKPKFFHEAAEKLYADNKTQKKESFDYLASVLDTEWKESKPVSEHIPQFLRIPSYGLVGLSWKVGKSYDPSTKEGNYFEARAYLVSKLAEEASNSESSTETKLKELPHYFVHKQEERATHVKALLESWTTKPVKGQLLDFMVLQEVPDAYLEEFKENKESKGNKEWKALIKDEESESYTNVILYRTQSLDPVTPQRMVLFLQNFHLSLNSLGQGLASYSKFLSLMIFDILKPSSPKKNASIGINSIDLPLWIATSPFAETIVKAFKSSTDEQTTLVVAGHFGCPFDVFQSYPTALNIVPGKDGKQTEYNYAQDAGALFFENRQVARIDSLPFNFHGALMEFIEKNEYRLLDKVAPPQVTANVLEKEYHAPANKKIKEFLVKASGTNWLEVRSARRPDGRPMVALLVHTQFESVIKEKTKITPVYFEYKDTNKFYSCYFLSRNFAEVPEWKKGLLEKYPDPLLEKINAKVKLAGNICLLITLGAGLVSVSESARDEGYSTATTLCLYSLILFGLSSYGVQAQYVKVRHNYNFVETDFKDSRLSDIWSCIFLMGVVFFLLIVNLASKNDRFAPISVSIFSKSSDDAFAWVINAAWLVFMSYEIYNRIDFQKIAASLKQCSQSIFKPRTSAHSDRYGVELKTPLLNGRDSSSDNATTSSFSDKLSCFCGTLFFWCQEPVPVTPSPEARRNMETTPFDWDMV